MGIIDVHVSSEVSEMILQPHQALRRQRCTFSSQLHFTFSGESCHGEETTHLCVQAQNEDD
jgi:hypothetical protein